MEFRKFEPSLFEFLRELSENNNRPWFLENKSRYEQEVLEPSLAFIRAFRPRLRQISEFFTASDRRVGGSMMRVYRDTRFCKGQDPYKTNVGIQFRHEFGRDIHAPGFYLHLAPDECFFAVGMWHPDRPSLNIIRQAIEESPRRWRRARDDKNFRRHFVLEGGSLKKAPLGFPTDHPLLEDLKRTDFIAVADLTEKQAIQSTFLERTTEVFASSKLFMRFLCEALKTPF